MTRYDAVNRVLVRVLILNLAVAGAKLVFGYATGAVSIISDGFHSLTDAASNVMGIVGLRASLKPPDDDHPYGHRKYETLAAAGIFIFLLLVVVEVIRVRARPAGRWRGAAGHVLQLRRDDRDAGDQPASWCAMRGARGRRLNSELLLADAIAHAQRRADVVRGVDFAGRGVARLSRPGRDRRAGDRRSSSRGPAGRSRATRRASWRIGRAGRRRHPPRRDGHAATSSAAIASGRAGRPTTRSWICTSGFRPTCRSTKPTGCRTSSRIG